MEHMFECKRCHYTAKQKINLITHLQRQKACCALYSNIDRDVLLEELKNSVKKEHIDRPTCQQCGKVFAHQSGLSRHKHKHEANNTNEITATPNITINTNGNNNTTTTTMNIPITNNNITTTNHTPITFHIDTLNVFGQENIVDILNNEELMTYCLKNVLLNGFSVLTKEIWFNENHPENHNVKPHKKRHPSMVDCYMKEFSDESPIWKTKEMKEIRDLMIERMKDMLVNHKDKIYNEGREGRNEDEEKKALEDRFNRTEKLSNVKSKKRGFRAPINHRVETTIYEEGRRI
jgi:ribosomal protein S27AE